MRTRTLRGLGWVAAGALAAAGCNTPDGGGSPVDSFKNATQALVGAVTGTEPIALTEPDSAAAEVAKVRSVAVVCEGVLQPAQQAGTTALAQKLAGRFEFRDPAVVQLVSLQLGQPAYGWSPQLAAKAGELVGADAVLVCRLAPRPMRGPVAFDVRLIDAKSQREIYVRQYAPGQAALDAWSKLGTKTGGEQWLFEAVTDQIAADLANPGSKQVIRDFTAGTSVAAGNLWARQGQLDKAAEEYSTAIRTDPKDHKAYYNLGLIYEVRGDRLQAKSSFDSAWALAKHDMYLKAIQRVSAAPAGTTTVKVQ